MDKSDTGSANHLNLEERIRLRAHERWLARCAGEGSDAGEIDDWLDAEREILLEDAEQSPAARVGAGNAKRRDPRERG